ncbi:low-density lipoprotein receptor-related protein 6 [Coccinella septempunctata]|uniref:low-density lipoprotein receptor-related protein 6 n=1 Tax=Coccinella septempunctata TaxID=41139 RepID=UPI001D065C78|nr:low-density lipoprotein receptor-related protein 6 [Coccinella septempunctata]
MNTFSECYQIFIILIFSLILRISYGYMWQGQDILLYSADKEINILNTSRVGGARMRTTNVVRNLTQAAAVAYNYEKQKICWSDHSLENIQCTTYQGSDSYNKVNSNNSNTVITGVLSVDGLSCDWITNKLYWTDSEANRIEVATMDGEFRKVLFWTDLDQPRTIALIPQKGIMVWTDWGETPKIEKAGMNGDPNTRKKIITKDIFWPNGLTIDYKAEKIYWIDAKLSFIDVMDYDGKNRQRILKAKFEYPHSLTYFQNRFYYTDWKTWSIHGYDKNFRHSTVKEIEHFHNIVPVDVHVWNPETQEKCHNPCEKNNGGCSHLCLLAPYPPGYTCACPIGIKNINNQTCADGPESILLLARRADICVVYLDSPEYTYKTVPLTNSRFAVGIDYDVKEGFIYWTDDSMKKIERARLDGSDQQDVVNAEVVSPDGIAIDWISRNIYWIDTGADRIEVTTIEKGYRKVLISDDLEKPRAIAVAPEIGWLFWSDWSDRKPKIERANLDGTERIMIVSKDLVWPNGVTLDIEAKKIYWCDAKEDKIEFANMDGTERRVLINTDVPHVFGLSLLGDYLYWTDWERRAIDRAHKDLGNREIIVDQLPNVMGLKVVNLKTKIGFNFCKINNGNCSQICLPKKGGRVCACQIDYELDAGGTNCVKPKTFLLYTLGNKIGRVGIEHRGNEMSLPISGKKHASGLDFDGNAMRIYWSDSKSRTIMRSFVNGSHPHKVIESGLSSPNGIAVDWLSLNIYWTDSESHKIEVSRLMGSSRRTLLCGEIYEPHSIVLDPLAGYMYWSEWGTSNSIKKAAMDGSKQRKLLPTTGSASSLALDYHAKRLYWVEFGISSPAMLSSDLDGNDKKFVLRGGPYRPSAVALDGNYLFWSDSASKKIFKSRKADASAKSDENNQEEIYRLSDVTNNLIVYDPEKHNGSNQCFVSNGGCSHLCLPLPGKNPDDLASFTCACPNHYTLQENKCLPPKEFMVYSQKNLTVRLILDTPDCPEAVLPISSLKMVKAIEYDPIHNFLYWVEGKSHALRRAEVTGTLSSIVVSGSEDVHPFDLALDPIGRILFWTCSARDLINVTRLDNNISFGVIQRKNEKPRLLAIHYTKRLLFYTDVGATPQIVRIRLDGSHHLVIAKVADVTAIAVDVDNDLLVWAQGHSIYISNIDGENQHVLLNESNAKISQLTVHLGWLYWIDKELHQLQRLELISGKSRSTLPIQASRITDLISVKNPDRTHPCWHNQKKCSHFCIMNSTSAECACPQDKVLQDDRRTCILLPNCGNDYFFTCSLSQSNKRDCIPIAWRCDMQKDCKDGSDEMDCTTCNQNQHRCNDGQCVDNVVLCDGIPQCRDNSDEAKCCHNSFQCPETESCIAFTSVCDGIDNCPDGADELNCDHSNSFTVITIILGILVVVMSCSLIFYCLKKKFTTVDKIGDYSDDALNPLQSGSQLKMQNVRKGIPDVVRMSMLNGSNSSSCDRSHITGASSSINGSSSYPRETLNPPPSRATTHASTRGSSPSSRYRPYRHYRSINQPPPPTPCSTDVCDESDYNYPSRCGKYDSGPFPPPPTPRSHCHSESCPPSPSSRSSTYFSPLPPPPSPVISPRHYHT